MVPRVPKGQPTQSEHRLVMNKTPAQHEHHACTQSYLVHKQQQVETFLSYPKPRGSSSGHHSLEPALLVEDTWAAGGL